MQPDQQEQQRTTTTLRHSSAGTSRRYKLSIFVAVLLSISLLVLAQVINDSKLTARAAANYFSLVLRQSSPTTTTSSLLEQHQTTAADDANDHVVNWTTQNSSAANNYKYAYAFVIGGCNPDKPSYRGYVYDILISARILKEQGSSADIVAFFQLSYAYKGGTELPEQDVRPLTALGVHIYYIPPSAGESFYSTVMDKFRILSLTQYRRVILLDGDVMPIGNLDYLFHLSDDDKYGPGNSTLKPNLVVPGPLEPANAGFFMLTPGQGEFEHVQEIIRTREIKAKSLKGRIKFDEVEGWGHTILEPDAWVSRKNRGQNWTFHFAYSDQGLLYYWVKYVKKQVSTVFFRHVENLWEDDDGNIITRILHEPFQNYSKPLLRSFHACRKFMCDFVHFTARTKPWLGAPPKGLWSMTSTQDPREYWWLTLKTLNQELDMGLNFSDWGVGHPSLGFWATAVHLNERVAGVNASRY